MFRSGFYFNLLLPSEETTLLFAFTRELAFVFLSLVFFFHRVDVRTLLVEPVSYNRTTKERRTNSTRSSFEKSFDARLLVLDQFHCNLGTDSFYIDKVFPRFRNGRFLAVDQENRSTITASVRVRFDRDERSISESIWREEGTGNSERGYFVVFP